MPESKTSPRRIAAVDKQRQALELRKAGATFQSIAQALNYATAQGAYCAVEAGLRKTLQEPADGLRRLDSERLDSLLLAIWPQARAGSLDNIEMVLKILTRKARLLGLDAPVREEITGKDGGAIEIAAITLAQRLQRIIDAEAQMLPEGSTNGAGPERPG